ncbi:MAG: MucB/RseB C-terminal domain-containing protein [Gallionella sp.]|nr:MucB/RseB C-terminal domain-containing protein [Gallionella sp.]
MKNKTEKKSTMRACAAFCGLLLAAANVYAGEQQDSFDWLKIVAFAGHQTDYSGIFVYQYDNRVETSRITHVVEPDGEYEKLESLDGPKREIIRHHGQVWCYINHKMEQMGSQHQQLGSRFTDLPPERLSLLGANYQANVVGIERVAGYTTQAILFQPKDSLRYAHKIWVHSDSGLLLKASVLDAKNRVVEQYAFTQLQLGGIVDRSWIEQGAAAGKQGADSIISPVKTKGITQINSGWVVEALPAGFKKTMEIQRSMRGKHRPVTQLVFSDGLSAISIFIEPNDQDEDDEEGLSSRGAMYLYHEVVGDHLITVVGEVPPRTLMQVFYSIRYNGK